MARLRGAIVGFGNVAAKGHWPAMANSPDLEVVAVVDQAAARREAATALDPRLRTFESLDELAAAGPIDFVDIATPPASHAVLAERAMARGWHVICEKPLTLDAAAYDRIAAASQRFDRVLFTMHNWKVAPIFEAAFRIIREGRLGAVRHADILVFRNQPCKGATDGAKSEDWRQDPEIAGGGILVDHGWHNFYLLLNLVGGVPERVAVQLTHPFDDPRALDDSARVVVQFADSDAFMHLTWKAPSRRNAAMVYGDAGSLVLDDDRIILTERGKAPEVMPFPAALSAGSHHEDWFRALLPHFAAEVRDPSLRGQNLREAGWCMALTRAGYESGAKGGALVPVTAPVV